MSDKIYIPMKDPDGDLVEVSREDYEKAKERGFSALSIDEMKAHTQRQASMDKQTMQEEIAADYPGTTAIMSGLDTASGGMMTRGMEAAGMQDVGKNMSQLREANPNAAMAGDMAAYTAQGLAGGAGLARLGLSGAKLATASGALSGLVGSTTSQGAEMARGERENFSATDAGLATALGAGTGLASAGAAKALGRFSLRNTPKSLTEVPDEITDEALDKLVKSGSGKATTGPTPAYPKADLRDEYVGFGMAKQQSAPGGFSGVPRGQKLNAYEKAANMGGLAAAPGDVAISGATGVPFAGGAVRQLFPGFDAGIKSAAERFLPKAVRDGVTKLGSSAIGMAGDAAAAVPYSGISGALGAAASPLTDTTAATVKMKGPDGRVYDIPHHMVKLLQETEGLVLVDE